MSLGLFELHITRGQEGEGLKLSGKFGTEGVDVSRAALDATKWGIDTWKAQNAANAQTPVAERMAEKPEEPAKPAEPENKAENERLEQERLAQEKKEAYDKLSANNKAKLGTLHPDLKDLATDLMIALQEQGIDAQIYSSFRTIEEQNALYNIGRDKDGKVIPGQVTKTEVKGGDSYHNYGLGIDFEVYLSNGTKDWTFAGPNWQTVITTAERMGFEAGYRWPKRDEPHIQMTFGYSTAELKTFPVKDGYVTIPKK
jgi:peptidoglycan L-alanyl-D-glutamate endopeptidase CwlK